MRKTIGILAHVDAGKTTFSEQALYRLGAIRSAGRVDHGDSFLDQHPIERERGITVFADQAIIDRGGDRWYWVDTPGHTDFAAEMERALPALDFAVLIVSCPDGVEGHTETIWQLLERYRIPTLIFVNKMDRPDADFDACLRQMRALLSPDVADFRGFDGQAMDQTAIEAVAERDEALLDRLMEDDCDFAAWRSGLARELRERRVFPAFAGAALTGEGIEAFLAAMDAITDTDYDAKLDLPPAARVYKVRHDAQGARQVYMKLLQGRLRVKDELQTPGGPVKINALKLRHGGRDIAVNEARAGDLAVVPSLPGVRAGDGVGALAGDYLGPALAPMLEVSVEADGSVPQARLLEALRTLEAEDPALTLDARGGGIGLRVMGGIQTEILARLMRERFGIGISFGPPRILYMETVDAPSLGVGHYEPLKHYAEVWLRLAPGERGSGITFASRCHVDDLALNWQRLIETHVFERVHPGVLTGAPLTDVRVELIAGRAHLKHTEGGDFREATYRAIRCALMNGRPRLLEPVCRFSLRFPAESYGRVAGDLNRMQADALPPEAVGEWMRLEGSCPYRRFAGYPEEFRALTHGRGGIQLRLERYAPVPDADAGAIISAANYDPMAQDSPDSVFCSHGAGHAVPWHEALECAHCEVNLSEWEADAHEE